MEHILKNMMRAVAQWLMTVEPMDVLIKLAAIGAMCWLLWCVFQWLRAAMIRENKQEQPARRGDDDDNFPPDAAALGI